MCMTQGNFIALITIPMHCTWYIRFAYSIYETHAYSAMSVYQSIIIIIEVELIL